MDNKMDMYSNIMDDICNRTNGEWDRMSYLDKVMTVTVLKEVKQDVDRYMTEQYPILKMWASLNVDDIVLQETEPDLSRFRDNNIFNERFTRF